MKTFEELIDKEVLSVHLDNKSCSIVFFVKNANLADENYYVYDTSGDCCNDVWFHSMNGIKNLLGKKINDVEDMEWKNVESTKQECEEAISYRFNTDAGYFDLEMRNSSNGYYGGSCSFGGKLDHLSGAWKQIKEDF